MQVRSEVHNKGSWSWVQHGSGLLSLFSTSQKNENEKNGIAVHSHTLPSTTSTGSEHWLMGQHKASGRGERSSVLNPTS